MSVYTKLMVARMKLHSQAIKKSGRNEFAKYNYMELADFLIPTQTIFAEVGLCGVVSFTADMASLTIVDVDDEASRIVLTSPMGSAALKGCHEVQNIGAVETYQRRYLWVTAMEIVEHDALDSAPPVEKPAKARTGVMADVLASLPKMGAEDLAYFQELADKVQNLREVKDAAEAYDAVLKENLDNEQMIYLWSQLDSKTRSALKAEKTNRTTKETA